ncbi:ankyrin repeat protein, putative [Trichomonas vaginalis G3]|uniref:Ankyrin repeat protein, putative n=1 Tax=Trichomonas vaginalis (strain ATCC PRA-98 / G3) TaxID=412133 RepID=A2DUG5_TRIV3|nr:cyclin-dependent kinase inhibitor 2C-related family [Trichomonas vaginalis G3]EAY16003.1 ankyrin repeat protein, putative [Trichomonas vaginalis G3]KAI5523556.1 cyclin-dependent kinase inhibitor 2C-related family [Trichomonas vaginalis G3]|eukprot:XP_001328226.1 ankyrin repeat protein [Trichomonas vaginalis G3]
MEGILINSNFPIYALYLDVTNDLDTLFVYSPLFKLASLSEYLLSHGANFNAKSERGTTALYYAAMKNNCIIIKNLISLGANVNVREIEGRSPLHYAACGNSKDAIELLINQGANIEAEDIFKLAPLHISVKEDAKEAAEALLSHGANFEASKSCQKFCTKLKNLLCNTCESYFIIYLKKLHFFDQNKISK